MLHSCFETDMTLVFLELIVRPTLLPFSSRSEVACCNLSSVSSINATSSAKTICIADSGNSYGVRELFQHSHRGHA